MITGITVNLRGRDFVVPPVTRGLLKKYRDRFKAAAEGGMPSHEQFEFFGDIAYDCISMNYPALTAEEFDNLLDLTNAAQCFSALMCDADGVKRAGEMMAALQSGSSTGTTTPPAFAAIPDGTTTPPSA